jgi:hypothetical protein
MTPAPWRNRLGSALALLGLAWVVSLLLALWDPTTDLGALPNLLGMTPTQTSVTGGFGFVRPRSTPWNVGLGFTVIATPILLAHLTHPRRWARWMGWILSACPFLVLVVLGCADVLQGKGPYYTCSQAPWLTPEGPLDQILVALGYLGALTLFSLGLDRTSRRWATWRKQGVEGSLHRSASAQ